MGGFSQHEYQERKNDTYRAFNQAIQNVRFRIKPALGSEAL